MKHIINQWVSYNPKTGAYLYSPWYSGKGLFGGKLVGNRVIERMVIPSNLGIAYEDFKSDSLVMYPKPLHLVARLIRNCYWAFLRFFYHIGLINTNEKECFRWVDFYRIKVS